MALKVRTKSTLKDVAQLAGCSTAVVSTVINQARGNTLVSPATVQRVWEAAKRLGYRPNFASRSLLRRCTETIGIYVPPDPWAGLTMRYEGMIVQGIEQACREHGYDVLAINLGGSGNPDSCTEKFDEQRIDGLILLHVSHEADWVAPLLKHSPNIAAVNYYGAAAVDRVNFDDQTAAALAAHHLAKLGHRRIGYLGSFRAPLGPGADLRCAGYRRAMAELNLAVDPQWVWDSGNRQLQPGAEALKLAEEGRAGALHLWKLGSKRPTAVVAYSDFVALHALRQWQKLGVQVPQQISLVGIDGSDLGELVSPELTSVRQPFAEMGRLAAHWVIHRAKPTAPGDKSEFPGPDLSDPALAPTLIVRESAVPAPGNP